MSTAKVAGKATATAPRKAKAPGKAKVAGKAPDAAPAAPEDDGDILATVRSLAAFTQQEAARCTADGDPSNAAKFAAVAGRLAPTLARIEKQRRTETDGVFIPRAELETRLAGLRETMAALTANGPLCRVCGERIRAGWADEVVAERAAAPAPEQA